MGAASAAALSPAHRPPRPHQQRSLCSRRSHYRLFRRLGSNPTEFYTSRDDAQGERTVGINGAVVLSISSTGDMAVLTKFSLRNWIQLGTLARAPLDGGAPRELLESVGSAD